MQRLKLKPIVLSFSNGCEMYLNDCRCCNLREATISHYEQSYKQFYMWLSFYDDMKLEEEKIYF